MAATFRRKVLSSYKCLGPTNMLTCTLSCGHTAAAYPLKRAGDTVPRAPLTVTCWRCAKDASKK